VSGLEVPGQPFSSTKGSRSVAAAFLGKWVSLWLFLCSVILPVSAQFDPVPLRVQQRQTLGQLGSEGLCLGENEVCPPETVPVMKLSWTEEFLQQMRAIATAAEFADPGIEEMDTVDNIAILTNHPGDRHCTGLIWSVVFQDGN
jgi:hypothetical protein